MQSKNKKAMTAAERRHVERVAQVACVICDQPPPSEVHEPEQGLWFVSISLCPGCHRGPKGWHGDKTMWRIRKMGELEAINETIRRLG